MGQQPRILATIGEGPQRSLWSWTGLLRWNEAQKGSTGDWHYTSTALELHGYWPGSMQVLDRHRSGTTTHILNWGYTGVVSCAGTVLALLQWYCSGTTYSCTTLVLHCNPTATTLLLHKYYTATTLVLQWHSTGTPLFRH